MKLFFLILLMTSTSISFAKSEAELQLEVQVGQEWGKTVASKVLPKLSKPLSRAAHGIAEFKGGTAFVIRTKDPKRVIFATNAHVMVANNSVLAGDLTAYKSNLELACHTDDNMNNPVETIRLGLLKSVGRCKKVIGIWPSVDFALFEAEFPEGEIQKINSYAIGLPVTRNITFGQNLAMLGFGHFMNPGDPELELMYIRDQDCRVFSAENDFRFITDPDQFSPAQYKVWSFVLGCDVSWGDSGAPILDLDSGQLVGIIFTGTYPKNSSLTMNPNVMRQLRTSPKESAWGNLNFGVPFSKIAEIMRAQPWPESFLLVPAN